MSIRNQHRMHIKNKIRLLEFFVIGVLFGTIEDLIAIGIATDGAFEARHLLIAVAVAAPFAFLSEVIVDHPDFWKRFFPGHRRAPGRR